MAFACESRLRRPFVLSLASVAQERIDFQPIPFYYHGNPATIHVSSNDAVARGATATVLKAVMDTGVALEHVALKVHPVIVTFSQREVRGMYS